MLVPCRCSCYGLWVSFQPRALLLRLLQTSWRPMLLLLRLLHHVLLQVLV
jgi:hypothetical protein